MKRTLSIVENERGLSLIELIVTMALVIIVLTMNTDTFGLIMRQSKQQTQEAAGAMDRIVGLEMLRRDAELAGFGLPWSFGGSANYAEATGETPSKYNDSPSDPPRAIITGNNSGFNKSDYLVIKSTAVGTSATAQKWSFIVSGSSTARSWGNSRDLAAGERVTVIKANASGGFDKQLVMDGSAMFTSVTDSSATIPVNFRPTASSPSYLVFGVDPSADLRMPFNRVDYFIERNGSVPQACAPGTGVLYKAAISHVGGGVGTVLPVLDCVADMQVTFRLDTNLDGVADKDYDDISSLSAQVIRQQMKEVRIYILSHEGERDKAFNYVIMGDPAKTTITVGDSTGGSTFDFAATVTGWRNYRWKINTLVIRTKNLVS